MTEGIRPTAVDAIQPTMDLNPSVAQAASDMTPRASNLSHDMIGGPSFGDKALAFTLALSTFAGGKVLLDSKPANGQEPSPAPSAGATLIPEASATPNPETGAIDPCATPEKPKQTKEPLPTPAPIAMNGDRTAALSDGTKVTLLGQSDPLASPVVALESPTPDPETAIDCDLPTAGEVMYDLINQDVKKVKKPSIKTIEKAIFGFKNKKGDHVPGFWDKYKDELSQMQIILWDPNAKLTKKILQEEVEIISGSSKLYANDSKGEIILSRLTESGLLTVMFLAMSDRSENPSLIKAAQSLGRLTYGYGIHVDENQMKFAEEKVEENMLQNGPRLFSYNPEQIAEQIPG